MYIIYTRYCHRFRKQTSNCTFVLVIGNTKPSETPYETPYITGCFFTLPIQYPDGIDVNDSAFLATNPRCEKWCW